LSGYLLGEGAQLAVLMVTAIALLVLLVFIND
jgi:hypothetical protein